MIFVHMIIEQPVYIKIGMLFPTLEVAKALTDIVENWIYAVSQAKRIRGNLKPTTLNPLGPSDSHMHQ